MNNEAIKQVKLKKLRGGEWLDSDDYLAVEEPLEIRLQYGPMASQQQDSISVTMRTPGNDRQLALGFLFTEGIIQDITDVKMVIAEASGNNTVLVILKEDVKPFLPNSRNFYVSSSCGVCGKASIEAITTVSIYPKNMSQLQVSKSLLFGLREQLNAHQNVFERTGAIHAAALFDLEGRLVRTCEDVGRHNALDKLIGALFQEGKLPIDNYILLLSGRASFELVQKAHMAGVRIIAAIGAPSSLSVEMADRHGICLVGFLREDRLNIYTGIDHIQ